MKTMSRFMANALACLALVWVVSSPATIAEGTDGLPGSGSAGTGVRQTSEDGSSSAFDKYRDLEDGLIWDYLTYGYLGETRAWFLDFGAQNILRDDEGYRLDFGLHGRFRVGLDYSSTPHLFTRDAKSLLNLQHGDTFRVADSIQTDFEALDSTTSLAAGDTAGTVTLVNDLLDQENRFDVALKRQGGGVSGEWRVRDWVSLRLDAREQRRSGERVLGNGTYIRTSIGAGAGHTEDDFRVLGIELPAPVDDRTTSLSVGAGFSGKKWLVDARVDLSRFDNDIDTVTFDNPFRATDFASGTFRNRFSRGRLDMAPDNVARSATVTGSVNLPAHSRITATFTRGTVEQDDPFPAYTLNTAISTAAGFDVTDPDNLPATNLDGKVRNSFVSVVATSRPVNPLSIAVKYRFYDYNNESDEIVFPGYAAFGESAWRTNIITGLPIANEIQSYRTEEASLDMTWRIMKGISARGSFAARQWTREERAIADSEETIASGAVILDPVPWVNITGTYSSANRRIDDLEYEPGFEAPFLRQFDQAERDRDTIGAVIQLTPGDRVTLGMSYDYHKDDYPKSPFGLRGSKGFNGEIDVTVTATDWCSFFAMGSLERREDFMHSIAKDDASVTGIAAGFTPFNRWNNDIDDRVLTYGAGADVVLVKDRLDVELRYNRTSGRTDFDNSNPVTPVKLVNAVVVDWPDQVVDWIESSARLNWKARPDLSVGLRWAYENFDLDDLMWDDVKPYSFGVTDPTFGESRRFLFLDQTYDNYKGAIVTAYVNYAF